MVYTILPGGGTEAIHKNVASYPDKVEKRVQLKDGTAAIMGDKWEGATGIKRFGCTEQGYWYHHESACNGSEVDSGKFDHHNMSAPNYVRLSLDETNNESYAYLASVGSKWRYYIDFGIFNNRDYDDRSNIVGNQSPLDDPITMKTY